MTKRSGYRNGVLRYPVSVIDHIKQGQDHAQQDVAELKEWKEQQEQAVSDNVIKGIKEMENFLASTPDTETLAQMLSTLTTSINTAIAAKYTRPQTGIPKSDMDAEVQASLGKADSALQNHQDISSKANISDVYTKQDVDEADKLLQTFAMIMSPSSSTTYSVVSVVNNPEFKAVITDSEDKIICGIRQDNSYVGLPLEEATDAILEVIYDINNAS